MAERPALGWRALLRLSLRNLARNPRRTVLTMGVTALGIGVLTFLSALSEGWLRDMQDNFILTLAGDLQVHGAGFEESQDLRLHLRDPGALGRRLEGLPGLLSWTTRVRTSGLASVAASSAGIQVLAVDPEREARVSRLRKQLVAGEWFGLAGDGCNPVILGRSLVENLGLGVGGRLVLMAQGVGGGMVSDVFCVQGVLLTGSPPVDYRLVLMPIGIAQTWLGLGGGATDLVLRLTDHDSASRVQSDIERLLSGQGVEVLTWEQIDPMVRQWIQFSAAYSLVIILVVSALVVVEVLNTMLMALHERTRELVVMGALGTQSRDVFLMTLQEGVILVLTGALGGYVLGSLGVLWTEADGLDLSRFSNAFRFFYMSPVIHPVMSLRTALLILATTLATALVAGLLPAWWAGRADPGDLLRSVER